MGKVKTENNHWKLFRNSLIENVKCDYNNIISITHFDCRVFSLCCSCCCYFSVMWSCVPHFNIYAVFEVCGNIIKTKSESEQLQSRASNNNKTSTEQFRFNDLQVTALKMSQSKCKRSFQLKYSISVHKKSYFSSLILQLKIIWIHLISSISVSYIVMKFFRIMYLLGSAFILIMDRKTYFFYSILSNFINQILKDQSLLTFLKKIYSSSMKKDENCNWLSVYNNYSYRVTSSHLKFD